MFEQFVGFELRKIINIKKRNIGVYFWRDHAGPEVDFVLENNGTYTPIEVKWTTMPTKKDIQHIKMSTKLPNMVMCFAKLLIQLSCRILLLPYHGEIWLGLLNNNKGIYGI